MCSHSGPVSHHGRRCGLDSFCPSLQMNQRQRLSNLSQVCAGKQEVDLLAMAEVSREHLPGNTRLLFRAQVTSVTRRGQGVEASCGHD